MILRGAPSKRKNMVYQIDRDHDYVMPPLLGEIAVRSATGFYGFYDYLINVSEMRGLS
jgi:hypothetical protein